MKTTFERRSRLGVLLRQTPNIRTELTPLCPQHNYDDIFTKNNLR